MSGNYGRLVNMITRKGEYLMSDLEVRILELEPMRVAYGLGFGESPEPIAWGKILAFGEAKGLLEDLDKVRFFGFNNPDPSPGSPNYGYEQWMTVGENVEAEGDVKIKDFSGGLYAVTRFKDLNNIGKVWKQLVLWQEDSKYKRGNHQWLEEQLSPPDTPNFEDLVFDLYLPIVE
jgi:AraC family transcriptional regulator